VAFWATAECAARRQSSARQRAPARAIVFVRVWVCSAAALCSVSVACDGSGTGGEVVINSTAQRERERGEAQHRRCGATTGSGASEAMWGLVTPVGRTRTRSRGPARAATAESRWGSVYACARTAQRPENMGSLDVVPPVHWTVVLGVKPELFYSFTWWTGLRLDFEKKMMMVRASIAGWAMMAR
jgi:hypothetical protein